MLGFGILKGMGITAKRFFKKKVTEQYPEVKPKLPDRSHGSFHFDFDKCIACNMCADACPNGVIRVDFEKDEKGKRALKLYNMNVGYCLFCGLCVKACPKKAINFSTEFDMVCYSKEGTIYRWGKKTEEKEDAAEAAAQENTAQAEAAAAGPAEDKNIQEHKEVE
jgi:NADH-quinone oxidoreductase subunit I